MKCLNIKSSLINIEQYTLPPPPSLSLSCALLFATYNVCLQIKSSPFNCVVGIKEKRIVHFYNLTSLKNWSKGFLLSQKTYITQII